MFQAIALGVCEGPWLKRVMEELKISTELLMKIIHDDQVVINISYNLVHHYRTKNVEIDRHFIKEKVENWEFLL